MIRNIVFDMGKVLLEYDPYQACYRHAKDVQKALELKAAIFDHPDWQGNLSFALKLEALLQTGVPGLSRGISLCYQRYNQHLTPLSLLCEFGAAGDTLEEALAAAGDFAVSLADLLTALP